jgi:hypothetical protein
MRRLAEAEKKLEATEHAKYVVMDFDGHYFGECGYNLSQEQFNAWLSIQRTASAIVIMKYTNNGGNLLKKTLQTDLANEKTRDLQPEEKR